MAEEDESSDPEDTTVEVVNISSERMKFELEGQMHVMKPGDRRRVPRYLTVSRVMQKGKDPVPSAIELLTNKKVLPITDPRARAALGIREPRPVSKEQD